MYSDLYQSENYYPFKKGSATDFHQAMIHYKWYENVDDQASFYYLLELLEDWIFFSTNLF